MQLNLDIYYTYLLNFLPIAILILFIYSYIKLRNKTNIKWTQTLNTFWINFPVVYFDEIDWEKEYWYFEYYNELTDYLDWLVQEELDYFYIVDSTLKKYNARLLNDSDIDFHNINDVIKFEELKQLIVNLDWKDILESKDFSELIDNI